MTRYSLFLLRIPSQITFKPEKKSVIGKIKSKPEELVLSPILSLKYGYNKYIRVELNNSTHNAAANRSLASLWVSAITAAISNFPVIEGDSVEQIAIKIPRIA